MISKISVLEGKKFKCHTLVNFFISIFSLFKSYKKSQRLYDFFLKLLKVIFLKCFCQFNFFLNRGGEYDEYGFSRRLTIDDASLKQAAQHSAIQRLEMDKKFLAEKKQHINSWKQYIDNQLDFLYI